MYLTGSVGEAVVPHLDSGLIGYMMAPKGGRKLLAGWKFACDNGRYGKGWPGYDKWMEWLGRFTAEERSRCLFATAPDVVGDWDATLAESLPWLPKIRALGFKAALVGQDGMTVDATPWDEFDVLFVGGSTEWKLSAAVRELIVAAKQHGKAVHVGRVNSGKRFNLFAGLGVDSVDGTYLAFGPQKLLPNLLWWIERESTTPGLFPSHWEVGREASA
jgi:hypothetical protein